ncbi:MAG: YidC/Oxa1 family membrane protein insertase [Treponema sp.]|nr:YidC/Oxa1 family membrane protein insertase [Treponema sp.]
MIASFFHNIIIVPIYDLLEFFYVFFAAITSKGFAVIALSFVVTLFCLPLYIVAEKWQERERQTQSGMKAMLERIKTTFSGDERYMMTTAYYRERHYHPMMALRSSFSLLIQIPFFIAAYSFLSNVESLQGYPFLFIKDFGMPDELLHIGSFPVNVLPIAMTVINCLAGAIYSKGHPVSEKIQIYACALVFLVLLYNSPAGLVVYWTMNNVLSLVKNVFYKLKHPAKVFYILCCIALFGAVIFAFSTEKNIYIAGSSALFLLLLAYPKVSALYSVFIKSHFLYLDSHKKFRATLFLSSAFALAMLSGALLPSFVIESSPVNFCYVDTNKSPFVFLVTPFLQSMGLFLLWPVCLYALFSDKVKKTFALVMPLLFFTAVVNCFVFSGEYGALNDDLTFMHEVVFPENGMMIGSICIFIAVCFILLLLLLKCPKIVTYAVGIVTLSFAATTVKNIATIQMTYSRMNHDELAKIEPVYHLSKTEKNVLVIMQDRFISQYIPAIIEEAPELKEKLDGFVYYPNTVSMSYYTQLGVPGLFGGYDYTPWEQNKRTDKTIQQKHNEAILTMPKLFLDSGFDVTVSDIPYENYGEEPVAQMYEGYDIHRVLAKRAYTKLWYERQGKEPYPILTQLLKRNFLYLSIFKIALPFFRPIVYHRSWWIQDNQKMKEKSFMDCYVPLEMMQELTSLDGRKGQFLLLVNEITHEPLYLQAPDYVPVDTVTDFGRSRFSKSSHYHVDIASLKRWTEFFQYLKDNDCYDNTRIIIVSDHGAGDRTGLFNEETFNGKDAKENVTALLMVKDFSSRGQLTVDNSFMTNADTPALALQGIAANPKNPFTGNSLAVTDKNEHVQIAYAPVENMRSRKNTKFKVDDDEWFTVHDDIYKDENWSRLNK